MLEETPIPVDQLEPLLASSSSDGAAKLNELLAVLSLLAFLWNLFKGK